MKMVKGLLLGTAAGLVALSSGAQAADLPVKAAAVEYVRICSVYGAGFYYLPGTDTCLKVGGYVRSEYAWGAGGSHGPNVSGARGRDNWEDTPNYFTRVRGILSFDARTQTEYGTLRAYIRGGYEFNQSDAAYVGVQYADRAFIQFAGFTFGKSQSFFDFYANALNMSTLLGGGSMNSVGVNMLAYTATFGGGFSATISLEDTAHHRAGLLDANNTTFNGIAGNPLIVSSLGGRANDARGDYGAPRYPDIIGNLRVDQPWGSAQISAAVHDVVAGYNGGSMQNGRGGEETGFAIQAGVKFNLPFAQGDSLWLQGAYANGAVHYLGYNPYVHFGGQFAKYERGPGAGCDSSATTAAATNVDCGRLGVAWAYDGVFDMRSGDLHLTEGWAILGAFQHFWTPAFRTTVFGQYTSIDYSAGGRAAFCDAQNPGTTAAGFNVQSISGRCDPDFRILQIGGNAYWSPVRNLDIGVEVLYTHLDQSHSGSAIVNANGPRPAGRYDLRDVDHFSANLRFQRNFWP